jgi:hypothetical protein
MDKAKFGDDQFGEDERVKLGEADTINPVDAPVCWCHASNVKSKKAAEAAEEKSTGTRIVEKYRSHMSRLSDAERERLMARGMQIVYGGKSPAKPADRH